MFPSLFDFFRFLPWFELLLRLLLFFNVFAPLLLFLLLWLFFVLDEEDEAGALLLLLLLLLLFLLLLLLPLLPLTVVAVLKLVLATVAVSCSNGCCSLGVETLPPAAVDVVDMLEFLFVTEFVAMFVDAFLFLPAVVSSSIPLLSSCLRDVSKNLFLCLPPVVIYNENLPLSKRAFVWIGDEHAGARIVLYSMVFLI